MQDRGSRYLELARRCRANAAYASTDRGKAGLMRMAETYDRRGDELILQNRHAGSPAATNNEAISDRSIFLLDV